MLRHAFPKPPEIDTWNNSVGFLETLTEIRHAATPYLIRNLIHRHISVDEHLLRYLHTFFSYIFVGRKSRQRLHMPIESASTHAHEISKRIYTDTFSILHTVEYCLIYIFKKFLTTVFLYLNKPVTLLLIISFIINNIFTGKMYVNEIDQIMSASCNNGNTFPGIIIRD